MFVLSNFLVALANVVSIFFTILYWLIILRFIISLVNPDRYNPIVQFLYKTTEPLLYSIRKVLPADFKFGIDISALIAFLIILFLRSFIYSTLIDIATRIK